MAWTHFFSICQDHSRVWIDLKKLFFIHFLPATLNLILICLSFSIFLPIINTLLIKNHHAFEREALKSRNVAPIPCRCDFSVVGMLAWHFFLFLEFILVMPLIHTFTCSNLSIMCLRDRFFTNHPVLYLAIYDEFDFFVH